MANEEDFDWEAIDAAELEEFYNKMDQEEARLRELYGD